MAYTVLLLTLIAVATANDLKLGNDGGSMIFSQQFDASAAIWKQIKNVTVNATGDDVIRKVVITDLREDKDGEAEIVDGGVGVKDVTVALKSPTVLRGYSFKVDVYAAKTDGNEQHPQEKAESSIPKATEVDEKFNQNMPKISGLDKEQHSTKTFHGDSATDATVPESETKTVSNDSFRMTRETELSTNQTDERESFSSTTESDITTEEVSTLRNGHAYKEITDKNDQMDVSITPTQRFSSKNNDENIHLYTNKPTEDLRDNAGNFRSMKQVPNASDLSTKSPSSEEISVEFSTVGPEMSTSLIR